MRRFAIGAGIVATLILAACGQAIYRPFGPPLNSALIVGEPYAVPVDADRAEFDLDFSAGARYLAVIGSLGPSTRRFEIACSSQPIATPRRAVRNRLSGWEPNRAEPPRHSDPNGAPRWPAATDPGKPCGGCKGGADLRASRSFALHVTGGSLDDAHQYATIRAHAVAEGREVRVYLDDQQKDRELAPGLAQTVAEIMDLDVIPHLRPVLGSYRDVDRDGRFTILLSPWLGRLQGGRTSVGGFVRGSDFQTCLDPPFSNRCDMMYVNSGTLPGPHLRTLLLHEYTHAVCFSRRAGDERGPSRFPEEEDWLNEAIAHCAESLFGGGWSNLDYRIARFLNDPSAYPLVVDDYYRAGLWRCHGCRGATYLFLRYCVERFGPETLTRIITNPSRGTRNIAEATGCPFDRLFRDWTISLFQNGPSQIARSGIAEAAPLDLYGSIGAWGLAGPRSQSWDVGASPLRLNLKGTTAAYVELASPRSNGPRRFQIAGPSGTRMQISIIRLPDDAPRIDVAAAWSTASRIQDGPARTGRPAEPRLCVRCESGDDLSVEQISAEQNDGETHVSLCFTGEALHEIGGAAALAGRHRNAGEIRPVGKTASVVDLPADRLSASDIPIIVKVVAVDRGGRRHSGWATVGPRSSPPPERLAQRRP